MADLSLDETEKKPRLPGLFLSRVRRWRREKGLNDVGSADSSTVPQGGDPKQLPRPNRRGFFLPRRSAQEPSQNLRFKVFYTGVLRMPESRRAWKEDDIARLKAMAGKVPGERIAAEFGRTVGAIAIEASKLGLSLRTRRRGQSTEADADGATAGSPGES